MKRWFYLVVIIISFEASAQSFPLKNVNDEYFVSSIHNSTISVNSPFAFIRDKHGIYWFQYLTEVFSFDGVNWKTHRLRSLNGSSSPFQINHIIATDDGNVWLATENGFFLFDRSLDCFISIKEKFPGIKGLPATSNHCYKGDPGTIIFISFATEGFFLFDVNSKKIKHVLIDSSNKITVSNDGEQIAADRAGNIWGTTKDKRGIWHYDQFTGKMRRSWKGELPQFTHKRFQNLLNLVYSEKENTLWIGHTENRYIEKMNLNTGKSIFYSFFDDLKVQPDTNVQNRHKIYNARIDRDGNEWLNVGMGKYIVKLNSDVGRMEYLSNDKESFPVGDMEKFRTETAVQNDRNDVLFWVFGTDKFSMIRKRGETVRHVYFDSLSKTVIKAKDFLNTDNTDGSRQKIFFEKGKSDQYFLLQQGENRPKLICFDKNFHIIKTLLNDQWRQYPAYFRQEFDPDTLYIAILRQGIEPMDFRNIVLKDFRVDFNTFHIAEVKLDFKQRVWRYGAVDKNNVYWLFSNGSLYSYDPARNSLDSIYISEPAVKKAHAVNLVKGYSYPTTLHKHSSTFWISFYPVRELYKINLVTKKIEKIYKPCMDKPDCDIPGVIYNLYGFDSLHIYMRSGFHGMLLNTKTNSVTDLSELVEKRVPVERPVGVSLYKDWICVAFPSHIYLVNKSTGIQSELVLDEDFKWRVTAFLSKPLINDQGELVLMSLANKGFLVFDVDSSIYRTTPGYINYSSIKVDERDLTLDSLKNKGLTLKYNKYKTIQIAFSDYSVFIPGKTSYEYALNKGSDTNWSRIHGKPELSFSDLSPGKYQLLLRASNIYGDYSEEISSLNIEILPLFRQTWWFRGMILVVVALFFYGLYRYRLQQIKRLQIVRNNIASDLHDDIGSTLNSISIYSEVAKQQAGKEIPALDMIGMNSRKIIESMGDIVWTINPDNDSFEKIIARMRSFAHQLLKAKKVEYTFDVDEKLNSIVLPMQVRKNFYLVFKEAINNLIKYSQATRVFISLTEKNKKIYLKIRDNGIGIPVNPETQGNGLLNMSRRAEEIHAELNIISGNGEGTEIEMMLKV